jgi:hypothetical protein
MYQVCTGDCPIKSGVFHNCSWKDYRMKLPAGENIPVFSCEATKERMAMISGGYESIHRKSL